MSLIRSIETVLAHQRALRDSAVTADDVVRHVRGTESYESITHGVTDPQLRAAYLDVRVATDAATDLGLERLAASAGGPPADAQAMRLHTALELVAADEREMNDRPGQSVADAVTEARIELQQDDIDGTVNDRQLLLAYERVLGAGRHEVDAALRGLSTREERDRSRDTEDQHRRRVREDDVLIRESELSPDDHSPAAVQTREVAESIRDHREMQQRRAQWQREREQDGPGAAPDAAHGQTVDANQATEAAAVEPTGHPGDTSARGAPAADAPEPFDGSPDRTGPDPWRPPAAEPHTPEPEVDAGLLQRTDAALRAADDAVHRCDAALAQTEHEVAEKERAEQLSRWHGDDLAADAAVGTGAEREIGGR